jgi:hypothetical protein
MSRHHTLAHLKKWIAPVLDSEGKITAVGYFEPPWQEDISFTPEEELSCDAQDIVAAAEMVERDIRYAEKESLYAELQADTITFAGLKRLLRGG